MSERRAARGVLAGRTATMPDVLTIAALGTPADDPVWHDETALRALFGDLVDHAVTSRLRMGGKVRNSLLSRWAMANGFASDRHHGLPDWRRLSDYLQTLEATSRD